MAIFMINYDLVKPERDYGELINAIKSYGTWCHPLESCWMIKTNSDAITIRDFLKKYMDNNDKILVVKNTIPAAWHGLDDSVSQWIKDNLN